MKKKELQGLFIIITIILVFIYAIIGLSYLVSKYNASSDMRIDEYDITYDINSDGSIHVLEKINFSFTEDMTVIYRDIIYDSIYNEETEFEFISLSVIHDGEMVTLNNGEKEKNGIEVGYSWENDKDELGNDITCSDDSKNCNSIFVRRSEGIDPQTQYYFEYKITNVIGSFADGALFSYELVSNSNIDIRNIKITINYPNADTTAFLYNSDAFIVSVVENQMLIECRKLYSNQNIDIHLAFNSGVLLDKENENYVNDFIRMLQNDNLNNKKYIEINYYSLFIAFFSLLLNIFIFVIVYKKYDKEYDVPYNVKILYDMPSDIKPAVLEYLFNNTVVSSKAKYATLMDLINQGYIQVSEKNYEEDINENKDEEKTEYDYEIIIQEKDDTDLLDFEKEALNDLKKIFRNKNSITKKELDFMMEDEGVDINTVSKNFVLSVEKEAAKYHFFEEIIYTKWLIVYFIVMLLIGIISFVLAFMYPLRLLLWTSFFSLVPLSIFIAYISKITKKTKDGKIEYLKWLAFKKYLMKYESKDSMKDGKYFSYAIILDVIEEYSKAIEKNKTTINIINPLIFYHISNDIKYSFNEKVTHTKGLPSSTGGFGGGGGFRGR